MQRLLLRMVGQEEVGHRIRQAREGKEWTQQQLADAIGVATAQSISRYERGETEVPAALTPRFTLMHEYGHAWDLDRLTETDRLRVREALGYPASTPWWGAGIGQDTMSPGERFADGYAHCALGTRRRNRRLCALLPRNGYRVRVRPTS